MTGAEHYKTGERLLESAAATREDVLVLSTGLKGFRGAVWHIEVNGKHYAISAIDNEFGTETMAFAADKDGNVANWTDLAMVHGRDHEACITELLGGQS